MLGGYFILPHPVDTAESHNANGSNVYKFILKLYIDASCGIRPIDKVSSHLHESILDR